MNNTFGELHKRFAKLSEKTGINKISSYSMNLYFDYEGQIIIELGGYEIGQWNRHERLGSFKNEQEALIALQKKIIEAEFIVASGDYDYE